MKRRAPDGTEALVAFIAISSPLSSTEMTVLDSRLRQRLPFYLIPALIQPCHSLPRTAHGEVRPASSRALDLAECMPATNDRGSAACTGSAGMPQLALHWADIPTPKGEPTQPSCYSRCISRQLALVTGAIIIIDIRRTFGAVLGLVWPSL